MAGLEDPRNSTRLVPEFDYVRHQTATGDGDVQPDDAVPRYWNRVSQHPRYGGLGETVHDDELRNKRRQTDRERLSVFLARCGGLSAHRGLQPHADQIDGVTRYDSGAASHLHRSRPKAARYTGSTRTEFDAISHQRRYRGAGDALRDQA